MAEEAWETNNIGQLRELVENQLPRDGEEDLRGFEWRYLWQLYHNNGERFNLQHDIEVWAVAFSPDGKTLATGSSDSTVKLWDPITGVEKATLRGHAGHVKSMAFSPDGKRLATGGDEGVVRLWDPATGQEVIALSGYSGPVASVAFSPDGDTLVSSGGDGVIRFWRAAGRE